MKIKQKSFEDKFVYRWKDFLLLLLMPGITIVFMLIFTTAYNTKSKSVNPVEYVGKEAYKDQFQVFIGDENDSSLFPMQDRVLGESVDPDMVYKKLYVELPLVRSDYYWGKFINANAASNEVNYVPILKPGDRYGLIGSGYLTMSGKWGYVKPGAGFMYASGVCWTMSTLGTMMDEANKSFNQKYDLPLFVFQYRDRNPHPVAYQTYRNSNGGFGYAIVRAPSGASVDYRFTVNPDLAKVKDLKNIKIKIVMVGREDNPEAYLGQSIGAYLLSNIDF